MVEAIRAGLEWARAREGIMFDRLYGEGDAAGRIVLALGEARLDTLRQKSFHPWPGALRAGRQGAQS
jgi:hypothetical protein